MSAMLPITPGTIGQKVKKLSLDDHHPNVVPMPRGATESLGGRIAAELTSHDEHSTLLGNSP